MLTVEQIEARKTGVGGSDMAAILGVSPYKTAAELWAEKTGRIEPEDLADNELVHFGNVLEDVVAAEYVRRRSAREGREVKVRRVPRTLRHKKYPFLLANLDRDILNEPRVLECKTADKWSAGKWGEPGTDQVPDHYLVQCQTYAVVADVPEVHLAVLIGGNEYRDYVIARDEELCSIIVERARDFWQHVEDGVAIEVDPNAARAVDALKRVYPGTDGTTVRATEDDEHWRYVCQSSSALAGQYKDTAENARAHLLARMGQAAILQFTDGTKFTRAKRDRKGYAVAACSYVDARWVNAKEDK